MKTKQRKNFFFSIILSLLFSFQAFTQETQWNQIAEQNGIIISYGIGECLNNQKLFLKVNNINNTNVDTNFILVINQNANEELELPFTLMANNNEEIISIFIYTSQLFFLNGAIFSSYYIRNSK